MISFDPTKAPMLILLLLQPLLFLVSLITAASAKLHVQPQTCEITLKGNLLVNIIHNLLTDTIICDTDCGLFYCS